MKSVCGRRRSRTWPSLAITAPTTSWCTPSPRASSASSVNSPGSVMGVILSGHRGGLSLWRAVGEQRRGCLKQRVQVKRAGGSGAVEFEASFGLERVVEPLDGQPAEVIWLVAEDQAVPGGRHTVGHVGDSDAGKDVQGFAHPCGDRSPALEVFVEVGELAERDGGGEWVDAELQAHPGDGVGVEVVAGRDLVAAALVVVA